MFPSSVGVFMGVTHENETQGILPDKMHIRVTCPAVMSRVGKRSFNGL